MPVLPERPRFRYRVVARSGYDVTVKPDRIKSCVTGILAFMVNARWNPESVVKGFQGRIQINTPKPKNERGIKNLQWFIDNI